MGNKIPLIFPAVLAGNKIKYLLRDDFTTVLAAGSVNGTLAEPGPGTRVVVDTGSRLTISGGCVNLATGGGAGDPGIWWDAVTRAAGQILVGDFEMFASISAFGIDSNQTGAMSVRLRLDTGTLTYSGAYGVALTPLTAGIAKIIIVMRSPGAYIFLHDSGVWKLLWIDYFDTTNPYYPGFGVFGASYVANKLSSFRIPEDKWLPTCLAYDTFTRANGAIGSTETTGPDGLSALSPAITARAWTGNLGTWGVVDTSKANCSVLDGSGVGVATVDAGVRSVTVSAIPSTIAGGFAGIVASYVDADNYIYAYHDGTNAVLVKRVGGVETGLISAAATYNAAYILRIVIDGNSVQMYYYHSKIGTTQTVSDAGLLTGTRVGLYSTNTGNKLDNFRVDPMGLEGQHSALSRFLA